MRRGRQPDPRRRRTPGRRDRGGGALCSTWICVATALVALGCAGYRPVNVPLAAWDPEYGYRPRAVAARKPVGDVLLILAFSGGGTRAAAFSYGVLQELRDTTLVVDGERRRLLDEVDLITSVSGGSFTSAYYALFGDRIFEDYEERFLRRNVQRRLLLELLRPKNWIRLAGTFFDRAELAIELYDRTIFDRATFADLIDAGGPFVQINAADLAVGSHFTFFQPQFDLICSDLSQLRVARAVAASSAVPVLFSPITLRNYAGTCGYEPTDWLREALEQRATSRRRFWNARVASSYLDADRRRYVHLVDGGIADNVGLRGPLDSVLLSGGFRQRLDQVGVEPPGHIAVVVVDAQVNPEPEFNRIPAPPSLGAVVGAVTGIQINRYTFETIELMDGALRDWAAELPPGPDGAPVRTYLIEAAFDFLDDPAERAWFNALPTSFKLDDEQVDRLIEAGRRLLRASPGFQALHEAIRDPGISPPHRARRAATSGSRRARGQAGVSHPVAKPATAAARKAAAIRNWMTGIQIPCE